MVVIFLVDFGNVFASFWVYLKTQFEFYPPKINSGNSSVWGKFGGQIVPEFCCILAVHAHYCAADVAVAVTLMVGHKVLEFLQLQIV